MVIRGRLQALTPTVIVVCLTVLGGALRFGTLDVQSVWLDEATTMVLVRHSLAGMLSHLYSEETPPLYFVVVWAWTKVFGVGVLGFRSLSALLGTSMIPIMYAVGQRISTRVGLWAAALTTVNPAMYYYSQEARAYALLIVLSAAGFLFWLRALRDRDGRSLTLWAAMSVLALLTHYFAIFMFIPEATLLLCRLGWRQMRVPVGMVALTGVALLPLALWQNSTYGDVLERSSTASRAAGAVKQLLVGLYGPLEIYSALFTGLIAAAAVGLLWRGGKARARQLALEIGFVGAGVFLLPLVLALIHVAGYSFEGRHLISAWIPWALLVAMGLGMTHNLRVGLLLGLALFATSLAVIVGVNAVPGYQRDNWRGSAAALASDTDPSVIVTPQEGLVPLSIYLPHLKKLTGSHVLTRELEFVALRSQRTGRSPLGPVVPTNAPRGYRLIEVKRTETFAISRFRASMPIVTSARVLRAAEGQSESEVLFHY
jgi:4-amino-4-deoxy-L-arabinose transferase-like glycosyltransferase